MGKRKPGHVQSFAATVRQVRATAEAGGHADVVPWPNPLREGEWTDREGVVWLRRRDREPDTKRIEHLLQDPETRVLLVYGPEPSEIPFAERKAFWDAARPYVLGKVRRSKDDYTDFCFGEFRDEQNRDLLIVQQYC
jgi:hypothetical protein